MCTDDVPGHGMEITVQKNGDGRTVHFPLERISSAEIADRRRLFELFTAMKAVSKNATHQSQAPTARATLSGMLSHTVSDNSKSESQLVDEIVALWTKIVMDEESEKRMIVENVLTMQNEAHEQLVNLKAVLVQMCNVFLVTMQEIHDKCHVQKAADTTKLVNDLEGQLKALKAKYDEEVKHSEDLKVRVEAMDGLEEKLQQLKMLLTGANLDNEHLRGRIKELQVAAVDKDGRIEMLEQERDRALMDAEHAKGQLEELQGSLPFLRKTLDKAKTDRDDANTELSKLSGMLAELRSEHAQCEDEVQMAEEATIAAKNAQAALKGVNEELRENSSKYAEQLKRAEESRDGAVSELARLRAYQGELVSRLDASDAEANKLREQLQRSLEDATQYRGKYEECFREHALCAESISELQGYGV